MTAPTTPRGDAAALASAGTLGSMDPRYPLRAAATPDGLPGEMLGPITAPLAPAPAEGCPVDGVVLPWPAGHALAAATVARMARRGFIACADVWMEVGDAVGVEAALAYVVRAEDGAAPYATGAAGPADASGVCRVLPEPFGPAWAVLTARALDGAALLRTPYPDSTPVWGPSAGGAPDGAAGGAAEDAADAPPDPLAADVARFLTAAQTDAGLYARILGALLSTLGTPDAHETRALSSNADDSAWTRGDGWRAHAPLPSIGPRGLHPVAALFLAYTGRPAPTQGLPLGLLLPPVRPRRG